MGGSHVLVASSRELGNASNTDQCVCGDQDHEADIVWCIGPLWVSLLARLCQSRLEWLWWRTVQNRASDDIDAASEGFPDCRGASTLSHRLRAPLRSVRSIFWSWSRGDGLRKEYTTEYTCVIQPQYPLADPPNFESRPVVRKDSDLTML